MSTVKVCVIVLACNLFTMAVVAIRGDLVATGMCVLAVAVTAWALNRAMRNLPPERR